MNNIDILEPNTKVLVYTCPIYQHGYIVKEGECPGDGYYVQTEYYDTPVFYPNEKIYTIPYDIQQLYINMLSDIKLLHQMHSKLYKEFFKDSA